MALSTKAAWETFLKKANVPAADAAIHAKTFHENRIQYPSDLTKDILKDLGVNIVGDQISILKLAKSEGPRVETTEKSRTVFKPQVSLPRVNAEMTPAEFRKFRTDWTVYKSITQLPDDQKAPQLYTACDSEVQTCIVNTISDFFSKDEDDILNSIESIVTRQSNPAVHRLAFSNLCQSDGETVKSFLVRLKSSANDCAFECPSCQFNLSEVHIKDQLIRGITNASLQTDILAKSTSLKTLDDVLKHAEAFESAIHDQSMLAETSPAEVMRFSDYRYKRSNRNSKPSFQKPAQQAEKVTRSSCRGCGSRSHGAYNRSTACPAWGQTCHICGIRNHFASVCNNKDKQHVSEIKDNDPLIAHVTLVGDTLTTVSAITIQEIPAEVTRPGKEPINVNIFPDSGASICLAGTCHLDILNITEKDLTPCSKKVMAVGGSILTCKGWISLDFKVGNSTTNQPLYICDNVDRIYFSREACTDVNILPPSFPYPISCNNPDQSINSVSNLDIDKESACSARVLPFPATEKNIEKLKDHLINKFSSVFTKSTPFSAMKCKPVHIHLKENAVPSAIHTPIPVPIHWRDEVKSNLDKDVESGIIEPVPIGEPTIWCSQMITVEKSNGKLRRTVDFQKLNSQCVRETHHAESPFKLSSQIPPHTKKTVLDATDGYHAIPLDEESKPLTTFITEWGRYRYCRLPQGYLASGDAYTSRYDHIIKDVKNKVKIVDDTLLWDSDIASSYFHTYDYLTICEQNGITINAQKFQFCKDEVDFAGLKITEDGIKPSEKILKAIRDFPTPKDLTGARSWFGIVNQIAWAYSNATAMQPFRELVQSKSKFYWDSNLDKLFKESKEYLIAAAIDGIKSFDKDRNTCLQTDWCRDGIGYLLLQQYCKCISTKSPLCCKEGWKLVLAGSRFTKGAETRYSPTEGEALAVAWSLEHARYFVKGCRKLTVSTDHKPLLGILQDRSFASISNPRLLKLKQRTLPFHFKTQYNPGKWHRGPDALSRNPTQIAPILALFSVEDECTPQLESICTLTVNPEPTIINITEMEKTAAEDTAYRSLLMNVISGFPKSKELLDPCVKPFWNVKDRLSFNGNLILLEDRIVIPTKYQGTVLNNLHSAHQGVSSMLRRALSSIYWPNLEAAIRNKRYSCKHCNERSPTQQKEPYNPSQPPQYPFQEICLDYFQEGHHHYISCVDRFSAWILIYHFPKQATSKELIKILRDVFTCYGAAETIDTDGGPQFTSNEFITFLKTWGIRHRISSVDYPQSNGRAELGVKSAKRIILNNTNSDGSLHNEKAATAIMQYRNTPIPDIGLSPAQILLHRQLRDSIPTNPKLLRPHKEWVISANEREQALAQRNKNTADKYNKHSKPLKPLAVQTPVRVQEKGRWLKTGRVTECLPHRQYRVRMDGSGRVTLRNRRFLRITDIQSASPLISPSEQTPVTVTPSPITEADRSLNLHEQSNPTGKAPRILQELKDHNSKGIEEAATLPSSRLRGGKDF